MAGWGNNGGRNWRSQTGGSWYGRQPVPETFAALRERDVNTTWREFYDAATDRMYYHNIITNKSQWEHPGVAVKKQPPPPSSQPPPTRVNRNDEPEHKQWKHITKDSARGKHWYNKATGKRQLNRPTCCMKYKK